MGRFDIELSFLEVLGISSLIALFAAAIAMIIIRRIPTPKIKGYRPSKKEQNLQSLEKAIRHLQRARTQSIDETHSQITQILSTTKQLSSTLKEKTVSKPHSAEYRIVEKMFVYLQILSACFVAFAHGANDVANAIGPVAAVLDVLKHGKISAQTYIPTWLLLFGGAGIVLGLAIWGWRVIETIGKKITELTPTRGFCAEFGAATTILIASKFGLPVSTTNCLVGAVLGVGLARGISALNLSTIRDILVSWIVTLPASALMSILFYYLLKAIFVSS